ncbi:MAG: Type pilus assembly protein PilM [Candidatus Parcubacteria bacterium]|jgi:cell division ATPase FtsA
MFGKKEILQPLIIDISENRVSVIDYTIDNKTGNTIIQALGETKLPFGVVSTDFVEQEDILTKAIEEAITQVRPDNSNAKEQSSVVFGVSGPMVEVIPRVIELQRENPNQKIRSKEWVNSIDNVYDKFDSEVYNSVQGHNLPLSLVQISLNNIILDGQEFLSPIDQSAQQITLDTINTYIPTSYKQSLINIARANDLQVEGVYHYDYGVGQLILDYNTNKDISIILIDIRFGHTSISVIQDQKIKYANSFSVGSHSFTQAIANTFQITIDEAETVRQEYSMLQLPRDMSRKITDALESEISLWLQGIIYSLKSLNIANSPTHIFLYGEGSQLLGVKESLEYSTWYKSLNLTQKPSISVLTPKQFAHIVDMTSHIEGAKFVDMLGLVHLSSIPLDIHLPYRISE